MNYDKDLVVILAPTLISNRTPGAARFVVSGGLSYLPSFRLEASQELRLGVTALGFSST